MSAAWRRGGAASGGAAAGGAAPCIDTCCAWNTTTAAKMPATKASAAGAARWQPIASAGSILQLSFKQV